MKPTLKKIVPGLFTRGNAAVPAGAGEAVTTTDKRAGRAAATDGVAQSRGAVLSGGGSASLQYALVTLCC